MTSQDIWADEMKASGISNSERSFPVLTSMFLSVALLGAEHSLPENVMFGADVDRQVEVMSNGNIVHEIAYLFIGLVGSFWLFRYREKVFPLKNRLSVAFAGLVLWCLASICWAQDALVSGRRFTVLALMIVGAAGAFARWPVKATVQFVAMSASAHLAIGLIGEIIAAHFAPWDSEYRFAGTLYWNQQGLCCVFLSLSSLVASDMDRRYRVAFRSIFIFGVVFLVLTKSRSSLIGFAVGLVFYLLLTRSSAFRIKTVLAIGFSGVLLYALGWLNAILAVLSRSGEGAENLTGRTPLWEECLDFAKDHIVKGYGYEDFWTPQHIDYLTEEFHWTISAAHSGYLEAVLTLGLIGLLLHVSVLALGVWHGASRYRRTGSPVFALVSSLCVVYVIVGAFEGVLVVEPSPVSFYFTVLFLALCLKKLPSATQPTCSNTFVNPQVTK